MVPSAGGPYAERQPAGAERDAVVAVVTVAEHVPVDDDVAEDPVIAAGRNRAGRVLARVRFHPPLDREIRGADVDRVPRHQQDLDPVDVVDAVAMEAQRKTAGGGRGRAAGQQARRQSDQGIRLKGRPIHPRPSKACAPEVRAPWALSDRDGEGRRSRIVRPISEMAGYEPRYRPRFVRLVLARSGFQRSPTFASRARTLSKRKSSIVDAPLDFLPRDRRRHGRARRGRTE